MNSTVTSLRLYTYFRSSAAYRVRIALNLKGLDYTAVPVHLLRGGGEQHGAAFAELSPARLVPVLEDGAVLLTQSLAIIEYLEEVHPMPPLLPADAASRAASAAQSSANQASTAASSAQSTANQALSAAQAAQASCDATNEKIDRMFKKSVSK